MPRHAPPGLVLISTRNIYFPGAPASETLSYNAASSSGRQIVLRRLIPCNCFVRCPSLFPLFFVLFIGPADTAGRPRCSSRPLSPGVSRPEGASAGHSAILRVRSRPDGRPSQSRSPSAHYRNPRHRRRGSATMARSSPPYSPARCHDVQPASAAEPVPSPATLSQSWSPPTWPTMRMGTESTGGAWRAAAQQRAPARGVGAGRSCASRFAYQLLSSNDVKGRCTAIWPPPCLLSPALLGVAGARPHCAWPGQRALPRQILDSVSRKNSGAVWSAVLDGPRPS